MSMPSTDAGPGWPTWFQTKSSPPNAFAVRHDAPRVLVAREIGNDRQRAPARRLDLGHHRLDPRLVDVDHADRRALLGKPERARAPHAGSRRRHDPILSFKRIGSSSDAVPIYLLVVSGSCARSCTEPSVTRAHPSSADLRQRQPSSVMATTSL